MSLNSFPGQMTAEQLNMYRLTGEKIASAIEQAKSAGVPQGLIVAMLHGHAHVETSKMVAS